MRIRNWFVADTGTGACYESQGVPAFSTQRAKLSERQPRFPVCKPIEHGSYKTSPGQQHDYHYKASYGHLECVPAIPTRSMDGI